ncbi:endonuclease/exonuclease/phosphatase family protein [Brevibacterium ihuae]|uniref:endonuclease/exonuclease/phosphatase family protein n=1 Tax=Brevibacterium ihuae TaxID=1631743 RepID=UPI000C75EC63|nr:endonuclease/exonuclease/phosphatase family protein [Brevibacterium ihuae]
MVDDTGGTAPLSVMSYNLRYPALDRNPWRRRRPVAAAMLRDSAPHLVGTQEGVLRQLTELVDGLPEHYVWLGEGRNGGDSGEFTAVVYDARRIGIDAVDVRWLSDRPRVAGSISWGARHPRTLTVVDCTDLLTGTGIRFLNTHLDHRSERSRERSVDALLAAVAEADGRECILTGDFNVTQDSPVHARLLSEGGLADAVLGAPAPDSDINTFHAYRGPRRENKRIDWILHSSGLHPVRTSVNLFGRGKQYPSDHFPIEADFALPTTRADAPGQPVS